MSSERQTQYLCQFEDGILIYVSADKENFSYESFRFYIGNGLNMREIAISPGGDINPFGGVTRFRDGGTTHIDTAEGMFFSPAPQHTSRFPKWNDIKLTRLNPDDYDIVETPEKEVIITKK